MNPNYQPLAEVRQKLRVEWYRCPINSTKLRELMKRHDLQGWFQATGHLILLVGTGLLSYFLWSRQMWFGFAIAFFAHGTVASFFTGVAPHELGHGTVFRTKWLNKFFLYLYSLLSWWDPFNYAMNHTYHHRYTLHSKGVREVLLPLTPSLKPTFLLQMFTINLFTQSGRTFGKGGLIPTIIVTIKAALGVRISAEIPSREWLQALHTDQPHEARKSMWWSRIILLLHGVVVMISVITGLWVLPLLVSTSAFVGNWWRYFVGLTQHCGLSDDVPDFRKCVRSITLDPLSEFLYWRMNWHTEHHMYAGVPCYNLKKVYQEVVQDMPKPRTLIGAWREMREIWKKQQTDPSYQFDTPLPETAGSLHRDITDELEYSIGELAPKGLR